MPVGGLRAAKGGPSVSYKLPGRQAISPNDAGSFDGLLTGSQLLRGGPNQFATIAWCAGQAETFEFGTGVARIARFHGKEGDKHGAHRADVEMTWLYNCEWLKRFPGYEDAIPANARLLMQTNPDVLLETNDGVSVNADSAMDGGVQVIPLIPDQDGAYDLEAARAKVTPPGSTTYALSA